uniref:Uncharacterized protein n=1 Tax=Glossina palpalis gambiensis TaxID=67801 RepID=A0A1B0AX88_9MUSC
MFVYHQSNVRSYCDKYDFDHIQQTMTINGFAKIRFVINFNDNAQPNPIEHPNHDCLHELRPIVEQLNKLFLNGFKLFALSSLTGCAYNSFLGRYWIRIKNRKRHIRFFLSHD